jgi:FkbM family methyltransferase
MTAWTKVQSKLQSQLARSKRHLVNGAERLVAANVDTYQRLAALTPIAVSTKLPQYLFSTTDKVMGPEIYASAAYDPEELRWALEYLSHPQRGGLVLDVGANVGTTTIPMLTQYGASTVEAFEPGPLNFKLLRCNLVLNDLETRVIAKRVAISDQESHLRLELCTWNSGDNRIKAVDNKWEEMAESARPTVRVHALTLDDAIESPADSVSLVWVDVQGHEAHVLAGASSLLKAKVPWVIEYWPYALTRAGGLERLHSLIAENFSGVVEIRRSMERGQAVVVPARDVGTLAERDGGWYTDLILLP